MTENTPKGLILLITGLIAAYLIAKIQESKSLRELAVKWSGMTMWSRLGVLTILILACAYAGSKPTNYQSQSSISIPVVQLPSVGMISSSMSTAFPDTENSAFSQEYPTLGSNTMVLGYALVEVLTNSYADHWISLDRFPSNAVITVADASLYGIHQETFYASNTVPRHLEYCGRAVTDLFYSVSGMLSVDIPHGTPFISDEVPDRTGIEYIEPDCNSISRNCRNSSTRSNTSVHERLD